MELFENKKKLMLHLVDYETVCSGRRVSIQSKFHVAFRGL